MLDVYLTLSFQSILICLLLLKYREATQEQKLIGTLILVSFPFELYAGYLQWYKLNNLFIYHILTPVHYTFYAFIYNSAIQSKRIKKFIILSVPVVILTTLILGYTIQKVDKYNSYAIVLSYIFIATWIFIYYRETFVQLRIIRLDREPLFWISTGLLFYTLGGFFVEGLMNNLIQTSIIQAKMLYYSVSVVLQCFLYTMFIISFLCRSSFNT